MPSRALSACALTGIFQGWDISQIQTMARPGGNPNLLKVRNTDTTAANLKRQLSADKQALALFEWIQLAVDDGCQRTEWVDWLNSHGHLTRGRRPWSRRTMNRAINRLLDRDLLPPQWKKLLRKRKKGS